MCNNSQEVLKIILYSVKWSLLHTLAAKHKSTIRKVLINNYPDLEINRNIDKVRFVDKEELLKIKRNINKNNNSYSKFTLN